MKSAIFATIPAEKLLKPKKRYRSPTEKLFLVKDQKIKKKENGKENNGTKKVKVTDEYRILSCDINKVIIKKVKCIKLTEKGKVGFKL
jgi:hypothetical protein